MAGGGPYITQFTLLPKEERAGGDAGKGVSRSRLAHIHAGAVGVTGRIVAVSTMSGASSGCVHASRHTIVHIISHPSHYYVNIHNKPFPAGAARSQQ